MPKLPAPLPSLLVTALSVAMPGAAQSQVGVHFPIMGIDKENHSVVHGICVEISRDSKARRRVSCSIERVTFYKDCTVMIESTLDEPDVFTLMDDNGWVHRGDIRGGCNFLPTETLWRGQGEKKFRFRLLEQRTSTSEFCERLPKVSTWDYDPNAEALDLRGCKTVTPVY
jgi:hypothetical protein